MPHDRSLATLPLYFYPSSDSAPKAVLIFLGNDVAFWKAHEELALQLSHHGYDVVGIDIKKYIGTLPKELRAREQRFQTTVPSIISRSVAELHAQALPLVLGGHSYGADLAFWIAAHTPPQHLVGVLALSPTSRSHLYVTLEDIANIKDPTEPGSFSIAQLIHDLPPTLRIALLRGSHDARIRIDSSLITAGGGRLRYTEIPLASHSLRSMTIAGPMTRRALDWVVNGS